MKIMTKPEYERWTASTRDERMKWWREAKFGMFVHYGLYAMIGRNEWAQVDENIPPEEYAKLADDFPYKKGMAEEWVKLAKASGMKYIVLTTRHHDGFSLWDSKVNPFNSVNYGPKVDIVKEFTDACRKHGMRIGLYNSLMDWHNPDAFDCMSEKAAYDRFIEYTYELNRELMTNYGKIDILWYDGSNPLCSAAGWDSLRRNQMIRKLQPEIIINNRSCLDEDYGTPEAHITPMERDWEACMTFNGISWGYVNSEYAASYSYTPSRILTMLNTCVECGGNLLLNIGPKPDGSIPEEVVEPLTKVGAWLSENGESVYSLPRVEGRIGGNGVTYETQNGNNIYLWNRIWCGEPEIGVGGYVVPPEKITLLATGEELEFEALEHRLIIKNLPKDCPDKHAGVAVFKLEFKDKPQYIYASRYPQLHGGEKIL
ncbi:MAG: alpha-L-fucosidase [Clostridia bacterium]|nr:alpha-L-fucosidase [Clostridia bacterium]